MANLDGMPKIRHPILRNFFFHGLLLRQKSELETSTDGKVATLTVMKHIILRIKASFFLGTERTYKVIRKKHKLYIIQPKTHNQHKPRIKNILCQETLNTLQKISFFTCSPLASNRRKNIPLIPPGLYK